MPMPTSELCAREGPAPASGGRRRWGHTAPARGRARALRRSSRPGPGRDRGGTPRQRGHSRHPSVPRAKGAERSAWRPRTPAGAASRPPGPSPRLGPPGLRPRRAPSRSAPGQPPARAPQPPPPPASGPARRLLPASPAAPALPVPRQLTRGGSASCSRRARPTATAPGGGGGACCSIALLLLLLLLLRGPGPPPPPPGRSHSGPRRHVPGPAEWDPQCPGPAPGLGSARTPGTPARRRRARAGRPAAAAGAAPARPHLCGLRREQRSPLRQHGRAPSSRRIRLCRRAAGGPSAKSSGSPSSRVSGAHTDRRW